MHGKASIRRTTLGSLALVRPVLPRLRPGGSFAPVFVGSGAKPGPGQSGLATLAQASQRTSQPPSQMGCQNQRTSQPPSQNPLPEPARTTAPQPAVMLARAKTHPSNFPASGKSKQTSQKHQDNQDGAVQSFIVVRIACLYGLQVLCACCRGSEAPAGPTSATYTGRTASYLYSRANSYVVRQSTITSYVQITCTTHPSDS